MKGLKANAWHIQTCNRLVQERMEQTRHERHLEAVARTRGVIDNTPPYECIHLKHKVNKKKRAEDRAAEIQLENRILLQKMLNIDTHPSQLSSEMTNNQRVAPKSLHGEAQRRELDRITHDNQNLLRRLQSAQPSVDPRKWEDEEVDRQALKYRMSQNSCRGRASMLRMPKTKGPGAVNSGKPFVGVLPSIGGGPSPRSDADWDRMTSQEIDKQLLGLDSNGQPVPATT
eukprot:gnl/TRDRNA2_/TRDRNA2_189957_c0_seq1.p1 gnl/TRDRNA2_/TRDRNA2_189957_c0~~gnl/TRDRNA2_/TRDRNA2_189957_c0_seq1.p1  ORF type:complete len:229 (-),score=26.86 gnl/TRDRNA2_/TRDRNA2_189957_c0_seq1:76-762(-)